MTNSQREKSRVIATRFVNAVNAETYCAGCGAQPIEWHAEHHHEKPNSRVSSLRSQGCSIDRIKYEMSICEPLCRSCHMKIDGRLDSLLANVPQKRGKTYVDQLPCEICENLCKPRRKGLCYTCYERHRLGGRSFNHQRSDGCCG